MRKLRLWAHRWLGWHDGKGRRWFDGCSARSTCSVCGKPVMLDSQGNWFTFE